MGGRHGLLTRARMVQPGGAGRARGSGGAAPAAALAHAAAGAAPGHRRARRRARRPGRGAPTAPARIAVGTSASTGASGSSGMVRVGFRPFQTLNTDAALPARSFVSHGAVHTPVIT